MYSTSGLFLGDLAPKRAESLTPSAFRSLRGSQGGRPDGFHRQGHQLLDADMNGCTSTSLQPIRASSRSSKADFAPFTRWFVGFSSHDQMHKFSYTGSPPRLVPYTPVVLLNRDGSWTLALGSREGGSHHLAYSSIQQSTLHKLYTPLDLQRPRLSFSLSSFSRPSLGASHSIPALLLLSIAIV